MKQIYKDIPKFKGLYQVSNLGNVKSLSKKVKCRGGSYRTTKERLLQPGINDRGYKIVSLCKDNKCQTKKVHRLVASVFLNKNGAEINHKDGNKLNNRVDNLEWTTRSKNLRHAYKNGLTKSTIKAMNKAVVESGCNAKLSKKEVKEIKEKYIPRKYSQRKLAREYSVHQSTIWSIVNNENWRLI
jgi:hypothetical protein